MSFLSEIIICPVCNRALNTVAENCEFCGSFDRKQLEQVNSWIDLTPPISIQKKPLRTEIFRSFWISFFYEKILPPIWALGLRNYGGGIDQEIKEVLNYFGSNLKIVLDLSCGTGIMARSLAQSQLYEHTLAIDYSETMLAVLQQEIIKAKISNLNLTAIRADVEALPLQDNSIDAIYCGAAMHCWENPDLAIQNIYRVLRSGGKLYLTTFLQPLPSLIFRFFSPQELNEIFSNAGFLKDSLAIQSRGVYGIVKCTKD